MADRKPVTPRSMAAPIQGPESRPGYQEYVSDPRNQDAAMEAALNIAGLFPMLSGLRLPGILQAAKRSSDLVRAANKADQYFRPDTPRPNSMQPEEMLRTEQIPTVRPKELTYDANYRDPAYFGKRTEPDPGLVAGDEGFGSNAANLGRNQAMLRQAEQDFIRDQLARMGDEGNVGPSNELLRRQINEAADRNGYQNQLSNLEDEGGVTADAIQAAKDLHNSRIAKDQAIREAEVARWEDEGGGMAHSRIPPVFTRDFTMGETVPMTHGIPQGGSYYGPLANRSTSEMVGTLGPEITPEIAAALNAAKGAGNSNLPLLAALGLGGAGGIYGLSQLYGGQPGAAVPPSGGQIPQETNAAPPQGRSVEIDPSTGLLVEGGGANYTGPAATRGAQLSPIQAAMAAIANRQEAPKAQERTTIDWGDPDRASDFFRASKQMQEAIKSGKDVGYYGQGEKRGGSVEKKPDSVHKALEIIHHLITG